VSNLTRSDFAPLPTLADIDRQFDVDEAALKDKIRAWFFDGKSIGLYTHLIVVRDSFQKTHEPRYANNLDNARLVAHRVHAECDNHVIAVYSMSLDLEEQLADPRPMHLV
jgi:hypothetical protein